MGRFQKDFVPNILIKSDLNLIMLNDIPGLFKYGISPNKLFEYFAAEKPILLNVYSGFDLITKYQAGKTIEHGSPRKLADEILRFKNMPKEEYDKYSRNARAAAHDFELDKLTEN